MCWNDAEIMVKSFRTSHLQMTNRLEPLSHNETSRKKGNTKRCRWILPMRNFKCRSIYCILSMYNNRVWLFKSCGKLLKVLNSVWSCLFWTEKNVLGTYANLMSLVRNSYVAFKRIYFVRHWLYIWRVSRCKNSFWFPPQWPYSF